MSEPSSSPPPSDEDRLAISRRLLLSSPPGQFDLILADLRAIHASAARKPELLNDDWAEGVRAEHEEATGRNALKDDSAGMAGGGGGGGGGGTEFERALREAMDGHMKDRYASYGATEEDSSAGGGGGGGGGGRAQAQFVVKPAEGTDGNANAAGDVEAVEVISYAENVDLRNCHAGSWSARYRIRTRGEEASAEGTVSLIAHAFENGNVQLRSSVPLGPAPVVTAAGSSDPKEVARAVVAQIQRWEDDDVQAKLEEMYDDMNEGMLKGLRRVMPVTRTRMDWNLGGHRLVRTMAERSAGGGEEQG